MMILDLKSLCGDLIKVLQAGDACKEAIGWINNTVTQEQSIDELLDVYLSDTKSPESYSTWVLSNIHDNLMQEVRNRFIQKISDPMTAFTLYLKSEKLTTIDDELLVDIFKGKLPIAENELSTGVITREKICQ